MIKKVLSAPLGVKLSMIIAVFVFICIIFAGLIMPYDPDETDLGSISKPPVFLGGTWQHILGTDQLGRDELSRTIHGIRVSGGLAIFGVLASICIGVTLGLIAGFFGGFLDRLIMSLVDFWYSIPKILIMILGIALFGTSIPVFLVLIGISKWDAFTRMTRAMVLSAREASYVEASVTMNAKPMHIIVKHILPSVVPLLVVLMTLNFPSIIMLESSLSFLGIGIQPPTATLGRMVGEGKNYLLTISWVALSPAFVILVMCLCMQTLGDWLRDTLNMKSDD